jgi:hypothetical protein
MSATTTQRSSLDEVIDLFKKDVDYTLIAENLKLTPEERVRRLQKFMEFLEEAHAAGRRMRGES